MLVSPLRLVASALVLAGLQGCLYTSHHFNTGRLLEPGKTHWEIGLGRQPFVAYSCPELSIEEQNQIQLELAAEALKLPNIQRENAGGLSFSGSAHADPDGRPACHVAYSAGLDSVTGEYMQTEKYLPASSKITSQFNYSLGWRLGVRKAWGPLTGVDLGWRLEAPTGPATLEFDARFGLPTPEILPAWNHSLSMGWGIGAWADNTVFTEYALGRGQGTFLPFIRPFVNTRLTYLATQPSDFTASNSYQGFPSYRRWIGQASLGSEFVLPDIFLVPRRILSEATLTYPGLPGITGLSSETSPMHTASTGLNLGWSLGLSWAM
jgi:hypothetical protein